MSHEVNPAWPKRTYQGLIFDCDGTLVDSMPLHFVAWRATMSRYGIDFSEDRFYSLAGVPTDRIIHMLAEEQSVQVEASKVAVEKEEAFLERLHLLRGIPPVLNVAEKHRGRLPIAVASGGYRDVICRQLRQVGCEDWFDAIVAAEDTKHHKPAPDVFLEAAKRLHVAPEECLVYEDSDLGIQAAEAARMDWIDIRTFWKAG